MFLYSQWIIERSKQPIEQHNMSAELHTGVSTWKASIINILTIINMCTIQKDHKTCQTLAMIWKGCDHHSLLLEFNRYKHNETMNVSQQVKNRPNSWPTTSTAVSICKGAHISCYKDSCTSLFLLPPQYQEYIISLCSSQKWRANDKCHTYTKWNYVQP